MAEPPSANEVLGSSGVANLRNRDGQPSPGSADDIIWAGSVSLWLAVNAFVLGAAADALGLILLLYGWLSTPESRLAQVVGLALLAASIIMTFFLVLRVRSLRYVISHRLIEREQGLLSRRVDALDLARVKDVQLEQSVLQRLTGTGTIKVFSSDASTPVLLIEGIPQARAVYVVLRDAVIDLERQRRLVRL